VGKAALGVAIGIPVSIAAARLIESVLYGLKTTDTATLVLAALVMIAVAALAAYLPGRRAAKVDPMVALRHE
jgi:ABC-type antimicrobial peptide transport system permease subunit